MKRKEDNNNFLQDAAGNNSSKRLWAHRYSWLLFSMTIFFSIVAIFYKIADAEMVYVIMSIVAGLTGINFAASAFENVSFWKRGNRNDV